MPEEARQIRRWIARAKSLEIELGPVEVWLGQIDRRMGPQLAEVATGGGPGGRFETREALLEKTSEVVGRHEAALDAQGETERVVLVGREGKAATIAVSPGRYPGMHRIPWSGTTVAERVELALGGLDNMGAEDEALADAVGRWKGAQRAGGIH